MKSIEPMFAGAEHTTVTQPPCRPELRLLPHEVDLWRVALDALTPETTQYLETLLSADEAERVGRLFFERDRRRAIVARGILRVVLGGYTGRSPAMLRFKYGVNGKPALVPQRGSSAIYFNVAHSEDLALYAFTTAGEVGIDVERIRQLPEWEQIAAACFSSREAARLRQIPNELRAEQFFSAWTKHEALLKAAGGGLAGDLTALDPRCRSGAVSAQEAARLCVRSLNAGPGFSAALAVSAEVRWATCRTWLPSAEAVPLYFATSSRQALVDQLPEPEISFP